jgi:hypothetical protein
MNHPRSIKGNQQQAWAKYKRHNTLLAWALVGGCFIKNGTTFYNVIGDTEYAALARDTSHFGR